MANLLSVIGLAFLVHPQPILKWLAKLSIKKKIEKEVPGANIEKLKNLSGYLEQVESDFSNFFLLSEDILCLANDAGYFIKINPAASRILGWSIPELLSTPITDFIHPDYLEKTQEALAEMKTHAIFRFHNMLRHKDGSYRLISWSSTSYNSDGITYAIGRDITETP